MKLFKGCFFLTTLVFFSPAMADVTCQVPKQDKDDFVVLCSDDGKVQQDYNCAVTLSITTDDGTKNSVINAPVEFNSKNTAVWEGSEKDGSYIKGMSVQNVKCAGQAR